MMVLAAIEVVGMNSIPIIGVYLKKSEKIGCNKR